MNKKLLLIFLVSLLFFSGCGEDKVEGSLDVAIQDQTSEPISLFLTRNLANITLLNNYNINDKIIDINSNIAPVVSNMICLKEQTHFYQGEIVAVTSLGGNNYRITLDSPLDFNFSVLGGCSLRSRNLAVNGAVTPVSFSVSPSNLKNVSWDITWIEFHIVDNVDMDSGKFGGIPKLTNGVVFRHTDGITKNIANYKYNSDFRHYNGNLEFDPKAPAGQYGLSSMKIFGGQENQGIVIRLNSETNDMFEAIIQDDLTGLTSFHIVIHGHRVER